MNPIETFVYPVDGTAHSGEVIDRVNGYTVIECRTCGFKHVIPLPTPEELDNLYKESFYVNEKPTYFQEVEKDRAWWELTYRNYYHMFEGHLPVGCRRLAEIGSGPGYFLKCGKELGWDVLGFEPSRQAAEYSRQFGVTVVNEFFAQGDVDKYGTFDVVYMNNVLEHLPDPVGLLKEALKLLAPGGIVCISSPNDYNPLQNILKEGLGYRPWWVAPPQHLNYFDFGSISRLLDRLGMKIVDRTCTFPMEFFLLGGENYVGNDVIGKHCHGRRKVFEQNMYEHDPRLYEALNKAFADNGVGREFVVIAGRK